MSVADKVIHNTTRIQCFDIDGNSSTGTGFFFAFAEGDDGLYMAAIVTNKHVIRGAVRATITINTTSDDDSPNYGKHVTIDWDGFDNTWIYHPDESVDLAALPISDLLNNMAASGKRPYIVTCGTGQIATQQDLEDLSVIEDVIMVGYPTGLWDNSNNLPIVRRGVTASPPYLDFQGKKEFVIDCACFPGSSGSPIYLYSNGAFAKKTGGVMLGSRLKLLGVLWGGPVQNLEGSIEVREIPTNSRPVAVSQTTINLGYCIKAERLIYFEEYFRQLSGRVLQSA